MRPLINAEDFGAQAVGVTDDTVAIQNAIRAAHWYRFWNLSVGLARGEHLVSQSIDGRGHILRGVSPTERDPWPNRLLRWLLLRRRR